MRIEGVSCEERHCGERERERSEILTKESEMRERPGLRIFNLKG